MSDILNLGNNDVESKIIVLRNQHVIIYNDVAKLYGVQTKEINQAIKNNPDKFPQGYVFAVTKDEKTELVKNFDRFNKLKHATALPIAFTEKGLYMLATILKSAKATQTTLAKTTSNTNPTINSFTKNLFTNKIWQ